MRPGLTEATFTVAHCAALFADTHIWETMTVRKPPDMPPRGPTTSRRMLLKSGAGAMVTAIALPSLTKGAAEAFSTPLSDLGNFNFTWRPGGLFCETGSTGELAPRILVIGIGDEGEETVRTMIDRRLANVEFATFHDAQTCEGQQISEEDRKNLVILGSVGEGRSAADGMLGVFRGWAAEAHIAVVTAGGRGRRVASQITSVLRELGVFIIGLETELPRSDGDGPNQYSANDVAGLWQNFDAVILVPDPIQVSTENGRHVLKAALSSTNDMAAASVRSFTDLLTVPGLIGLDWADIRLVLADQRMGFGAAEAAGDNRAIDAAAAVVDRWFSRSGSLACADKLLINVTGSRDMTLFEVDDACQHLRGLVDPDADIIFGALFDDGLADRIRVSVLAAVQPAENV